jgi:nitroreductase
MKRPIHELVHERFSCRTYLRKDLAADVLSSLTGFLEGHRTGPFGSPSRLILLSASEDDERALKGLGTYGTIRNPRAFIVGITGPGPKNLEDLGYVMEMAVLEATDLGLGTCWLGGFFRKSRFAEKAGVAAEETVPAVISLGYGADEGRSGGLFGRIAQRTSRLPAERLFFSGTFDRPLTVPEAGRLAAALEAVRWAPSASNKQPWRLVRANGRWHFYLQRTPGYGHGLGRFIFPVADLQRIDLGIAMAHFEAAAREAGVSGAWALADPGLALPGKPTEYTATWGEAAAVRETLRR